MPPESPTLVTLYAEEASPLRGLKLDDLELRHRPPGEASDTDPAAALLVVLEWPADQDATRFERWRRRAGERPLLLVCSANEIGRAIEALHAGIDDYLVMPLEPIEVKARLGRLLERHRQAIEARRYSDLEGKAVLRADETRSASMRTVHDRVKRVAPMKSTVLVCGESGVGKELVARSIHLASPRRLHPFIAINCAAIPANLIESELFGHEKGAFTGADARAPGKFEIADRGTLFLDEIGEMELGTQSKLLRVLEEREFMRVGGVRSVRVDVRVIAATNAPLESMVEKGRFRRDLYYRLKVVTIDVPPLRERRSDVPILVERFMRQLASENGVRAKRLSAAALETLGDYAWPGNVRELKNVVESLLVSVRGPHIEREDLPATLVGLARKASAESFSVGTTLAEMEAEMIRRTLEHTGGNRTHAAELLGIGVRTLQRKMRSFGIDIAPKKRRSRSLKRVNES